MFRFLTLSLALFAGTGVTRAAADESPLTQRLHRAVENEVTRRGFMGAVLVVRDGVTLLDRGYGSASLELEVPNTPTTRFRIGSITKQFTAAAILLLVERGKLRLEDPVAQHIPEVPAAWREITLYQLLTHTSGIHNFTALPEFRTWKAQPQTPLQAIDRLRALPLDFAPGEKHAYSNSNYLVLGLVIERASGRRYAAFLHDNVLDPLGLRDTDVDNDIDLVPRRAAGYTRFGIYANAPYSDMSVPHASGAMYSTTHDLRRWIEALLAGKLLSPASLTRMITPEKNGYALGLQTDVVEGRKVIRHGGSISGFSASLAHFPEEKVTIVVLANVQIMGGIAGPLTRQLAKTLFAPADSR